MITQTQQSQQEYWQKLRIFLEKNNCSVNIPRAPLKNWVNIPLGKGGIQLAVAVNSESNELFIWLLLDGEHGKESYDKLYKMAYKNSLTKINQDLVWDRMDDNIRCAIKLIKHADYTDENDLTNQFQWFKVNLEKFNNFFRPFITLI
jgi:hypothetical protein